MEGETGSGEGIKEERMEKGMEGRMAGWSEGERKEGKGEGMEEDRKNGGLDERMERTEGWRMGACREG